MATKKPKRKTKPPVRPGLLETWAWLLRKYAARDIKELRKIDLEHIPIKEALTVQDLLAAYDEKDHARLEKISNRMEGTPPSTNLNADVSPDENPVYKQMQEIVKSYKRKK